MDWRPGKIQAQGPGNRDTSCLCRGAPTVCYGVYPS